MPLPALIARLAPTPLADRPTRPPHRHDHEVVLIDVAPILQALAARTDTHELAWTRVPYTRHSWVAHDGDAEITVTRHRLEIASLAGGATIFSSFMPRSMRPLEQLIQARSRERSRRMGEWLIAATSAGAISWQRHPTAHNDWRIDGPPGLVIEMYLNEAMRTTLAMVPADPGPSALPCHHLRGPLVRQLRRLVLDLERQAAERERRQALGLPVVVDVSDEQWLIEQGERQAAILASLARPVSSSLAIHQPPLLETAPAAHPGSRPG